MRGRRSLTDSSGFTLVEVLVAILVISIGVLGTVALADGANRSTSRTKAREGATNVARDVVEALHAVPWKFLTQATAASRVQAVAGLGDADTGTSGWQINRRGTSYTVTLNVCTVDAPADGFATSHDGTFCALSGSTTKTDANPNDYKRATVTITWNDQQGARTLTQSTTVSSTYNGPAVTSIVPQGFSSPPYVYIANGTSLTFDVTTDLPANNVDWLLNGNRQAAATGSGTAWSFTWNIGPACGGGLLDGVYFLGAQGFDATNVSPGPQASTVTLNRCAPQAPANVQAAQSEALTGFEVQWDDNPETDVIGYRVYRAPALNGSAIGQYQQLTTGGCGAPTTGYLTKTDCIDDTTGGIVNLNFIYKVVAVDRDSNGVVREGTATTKAVNTSNTQPDAVTIASAATKYPAYTLWWNRARDPGDTIAYYNIYRKDANSGWSLVDRWDAGGDPQGSQDYAWLDPSPGTGGHWYKVTAVDTSGAESAFSNALFL